MRREGLHIIGDGGLALSSLVDPSPEARLIGYPELICASDPCVPLGLDKVFGALNFSLETFAQVAEFPRLLLNSPHFYDGATRAEGE